MGTIPIEIANCPALVILVQYVPKSHNIYVHFSFCRMLNEMEDDLDTATTNLSLVTAKTKELINKSGGKRNFIIIVVLSLLVVVLFFLIIYS